MDIRWQSCDFHYVSPNLSARFLFFSCKQKYLKKLQILERNAPLTSQKKKKNAEV